MTRIPQDCWEKVDMLVELDEAIKNITHYIDQYPPKHDIAHWTKVRKRLKSRKRYLEEFIHKGELDIEHWYDEEALRREMIEYLTIQGVLKK